MSWGAGLALLPILWAAIKVTGSLFPLVMAEGYRSWSLYVAGAAGYYLYARWVRQPVSFYVIGHELTHAVSGFLSGAKIHSLTASNKGGEVRLSKSNAFIALSPYIFPFYTLLVIILHAAIEHWWPSRYLTFVFQFLIGFTLSFHWFMTWNSLHLRQPDLKILGILLSGIIIALGNILILGVFAVTLFKKTPQLKDYVKAMGRETALGWDKALSVVKQVPDKKYLFKK